MRSYILVVVTKNPQNFSSWVFRGGGDMSPLSPLPYAPAHSESISVSAARELVPTSEVPPRFRK